MKKETQATRSLDKVKELDDKIKKLIDEKIEFLNGRTETDQMKDDRPSKDLVIVFVESIEKADQYYDFTEFLMREIDVKPDSDRDCIFDDLVEKQVRKQRFEKVDDEVIQSAIDKHLFLLQQAQEINSRYAFRKHLLGCDTITLQSNFEEDIKAIGSLELYPGLSVEELEIEMMNYKLCFNLSLRSQEDSVTKNIYMEKIKKEYNSDMAIFEQKKDGYADAYTAYNIVFRSRQGQYVMDQDPKVELEKLMKLHPLLYGFLNEELSKMMKSDQEPPLEYDQEKTVFVWNISNDASGHDIWKCFSECGEIDDMDIRSEDKCCVAYITFKDLTGLQEALKLERPKIWGREVGVEVAGPYPPTSKSKEYSEPLSEDDEAASGVEIGEVFDSSMFEQALKKYSELIKKVQLIGKETLNTEKTLNREKKGTVKKRKGRKGND